jgi:hypothetical protein
MLAGGVAGWLLYRFTRIERGGLNSPLLAERDA